MLPPNPARVSEMFPRGTSVYLDTLDAALGTGPVTVLFADGLGVAVRTTESDLFIPWVQVASMSPVTR